METIAAGTLAIALPALLTVLFTFAQLPTHYAGKGCRESFPDRRQPGTAPGWVAPSTEQC